MKIIEPSYQILQCPDGEECLAFLERCARTCYKSEDKIDSGYDACSICKGDGEGYSVSDDDENPIDCKKCKGTGFDPQRKREPSSHRLIRHVLDRGHESVIEHMVVTVKFVVDRGVSHELVRHRLCAFSQESTRYVRYSDDGTEGNELTFIKPYFWADNAAATLKKMVLWKEAMTTAEMVYLQLLQEGAKPEEARSVLPNSLKTEIVTTANLREWRHILKLRTSPKAHPQMRQVMTPLLAELKSKVPIIFEGVGA
jgi:thymidylate synthase (FAD)